MLSSLGLAHLDRRSIEGLTATVRTSSHLYLIEQALTWALHRGLYLILSLSRLIRSLYTIERAPEEKVVVCMLCTRLVILLVLIFSETVRSSVDLSSISKFCLLV